MPRNDGRAGMANALRPLLIVEDSDEDYDIALWVLRRLEFTRPVVRCTTGDDALEFLFQRGCYHGSPRPALVVLDLNLPGADGRHVLSSVKADARVRTIPVVILSTSSNPRDVEECYHAGASSYLTKPVDFERIQEVWRTLVAYWFGAALLLGDEPK